MKGTTSPRIGTKTRKVAITLILAAALTGISWLFWNQELKYQLPTAIPSNYKDILPGTDLALALPFAHSDKKPLFLHFFNPDCPCSKFNMKHFKELATTYAKDLDFAIVAMNPDNAYTEADIRKRFDLDIPVTFDTTLARSCGVYSTPQAVIIDREKLYFRGNYNKSRYCTDPKSNYAQMAIDSLLGNANSLSFGPLAFKAYGCELPKCTKP